MREWLVASGIVEGPHGLLLVQNRRRDGALDWSPPGGVVEVGDGESVVDGLTREVEEETGIRVTAWEGPVWEVEAEAPEMGWQLRVEVHRALDFEGELRVEDPDGIVVDAVFTEPGEWADLLGPCARWVREPLLAWLEERWGPHQHRAYVYDVLGTQRDELRVVRTSLA